MNIRKIIIGAFVLAAWSLTAAPSPWDSWRTGYTSFEQGESLRERGEYGEAMKMFEKARQSYLAVRNARPDWNQRVIADRLRECDRQIAEVGRLLNQGGTAATDTTGAAARPEAGTQTSPSETKTPSELSAPATVSVSEHAESIREIYALRAELERTKQMLVKQRDFEAEISALLRDRRIAEEKLALMEKRYQELLRRQSTPDSRIADLEQRVVQEKMDVDRYRRRATASEQRQSELQEQLKELRMQLNMVRSQLQRTADALKRRETDLADREREFRRREEVLQGEVKRLTAAVTAASTAKEQEKPTASPVPLPPQVPKADYDNMVAAYQRTLAELRQKEQELDTLRTTSSRQQTEAQVAATEAANLRQRNLTLEEDIKRMSLLVDDLKKRLERREQADFQAAAAARETRKKLEGDLLALQKEIVTLRNGNDAKNTALAEAERKYKALESEVLGLRARVMHDGEAVKKLAAAQTESRQLKEQLVKIRRDFTALATENRENRMLVEAAKPRKAELERAKLRLLELDRLKQELAREQQLNAELKAVHRKDQLELRQLRARASELDAAKRRVAELTALEKEVPRLREVERELERMRGREAELAALKIREGELNKRIRQLEAAMGEALQSRTAQEKQIAGLRTELAELGKLRQNNAELKALIAEQTAELDRMKSQLDSRKVKESDAVAAERERYRKSARQVGELTEQLQRQRQETAERENLLTERIGKAIREIAEKKRTVELLEKELADLKRINAELADYRKNSVAALRDKVDSSRIAGLEDQLASLSRINAELAAERDRLRADLERGGQPEEVVKAVLTGTSPEQLASAGVIAESDGKFELAIWNYRQALAVSPNFAPAHLRLGMLLFRRRGYAEAMPHLSAALAAAPGDLGLAVTAARCQIALRRYGEAGAIIEPLLAKHGDDAMIQACAALIDAGTGKVAQAEERLHTAIRLAPQSAELHLELAGLLASSLTDRRSEAVAAYERARELGAAPDPKLEKELGALLDHRRETVRFMGGAAREAELAGDWNAAAWYYRKLIADKHGEFVPYLAFAQWKSGNPSGAKETLEFNKPTRVGMVVRTLIALAEKDESAAMDAARQSAGAKILPEWAGMTAELSQLRRSGRKSSAAKVLLEGLKR